MERFFDRQVAELQAQIVVLSSHTAFGKRVTEDMGKCVQEKIDLGYQAICASESVRPDTENLFVIAIIAVGHLIERNHKGHFNHASVRRLNAPMNKHNIGLPLETRIRVTMI